MGTVELSYDLVLRQIVARFHISGQHAGLNTDMIGNSHLTTINCANRAEFHFWDSWIDEHGGIEQIGVAFLCKDSEAPVVEVMCGSEESFHQYLQRQGYNLGTPKSD